MNVTEFAEQIVFGKTLEDKLLDPGQLTHDAGYRDRPGRPCVESLVSPQRPVGLEMRHDKGGNVQPPSDRSLENEQARGQLLHFLANHELLATELMALVLLKFPDAPRAFRQGVLVTLREEQEHTRMYMRRMKECGVEFGRFPLSGQFWRVVEPMKSPMDFVSRLSLTFEQANLDFSLHYANVFKQIGDDETSGLLKQIYEDEIGHVQHGLHWFRQWKNPEQSDWEAYQQSLVFPMSPQRGRGPNIRFNRDGRIAAGLDESFIDAIEVFRQSRGRAPIVRWFDPASEAELAGELTTAANKTTSATALMNQLGKDLELVMVAMAKQDDVVLVRRVPSREIRINMIESGFDLPEFVSFDEREKLGERKLQEFMPWAWTPNGHDVISPLTEVTKHLPQTWHDGLKDLYRKSWSCEKLGQWQRDHSSSDTQEWMTSVECVGSVVNDLDDVGKGLAKIANARFESAIFKQDLGASGRGQRRLSCREPLTQQDESWLNAILKSNNRPVGVIEPELDRVVDLSFLWRFERGASAVEFLGWTRPLITDGRRFCGTRLGSSLAGCDQTVKRFLLSDRCANIQVAVDWLEPRIVAELESRNFRGYFGVDAFLCRDGNGELKIKPLVELNPRMTMGHIALSLEKRLEPGAEAEFRIFSRREWDQVHESLAKIPLTKIRDGRWKSGVIRMSEVDEQTKLVPVLLVGTESIDVCADAMS